MRSDWRRAGARYADGPRRGAHSLQEGLSEGDDHSRREETADGATVYQIESTENGKARIINYKPDGSIVNMQEELTEAEFPPAVTAAIKKRYPNATIIERVKLTVPKDSVVHYEAHLTGVEAVHEVILTRDGKWVFPK